AGGGAVTSEVEARVYRLSEEALSRARLEALIEKYGLYGAHAKDDDQVVARMRRDIRIDLKGVDPVQQRGTPIGFAVSYRGARRDTVAQVTNELAAFFVSENSSIRERRAGRALQDLQRRGEGGAGAPRRGGRGGNGVQ